MEYSEISDGKSVVSRFNNRDKFAYSDIYTLLYKSLYYYSYSLFKDSNVDCEDIIQDLFLEVWEKKSLRFETTDKIKSYMFVAIKNRFLMHCRHQKLMDRVANTQLQDNDFFCIHAAEAEIYSIIPDALALLPEDCAESFRLFIEGYSIKEIAHHLNKPLSTIYSQREKAVTLLKNKLPKDKLLLLMFFLH